jgi:hypothetical protein
MSPTDPGYLSMIMRQRSRQTQTVGSNSWKDEWAEPLRHL